MNLRLIFPLILFFIIIFSSPTQAAKKRTWTTTSTSTTSTKSVAPSVSARLTGWKQYLAISFRGVSATNGINYELTFNGNNLEQGIYGSLKPTDGNTTKSLFLGTCSHGACTSYKNINSLRLTVTYKLKSGQNLVKSYKVKY